MATKQLYDLNDNPIYPKVECIDNLNSTDGTTPLSAKQGKVLKDLINNAGGGNANVEDIIYIFELPSIDSDSITGAQLSGLLSAIEKHKVIIIDYEYRYSTAIRYINSDGDITIDFMYNGNWYRFTMDLSNPDNDDNTKYYDTTIVSSLYTATSRVTGGVKTGYQKNGNRIPLQVDGNGNAYVNVDDTKSYIKIFPFSENGGCQEVLDYLNSIKSQYNDNSYLNNVLLLADNSECKYIFPISNVIITGDKITGIWGTAMVGGESYKIEVYNNSSVVSVYNVSNTLNTVSVENYINEDNEVSSGAAVYSTDIIHKVKNNKPVTVDFYGTGISCIPYAQEVVSNDELIGGDLECARLYITHPVHGDLIVRVVNEWAYVHRNSVNIKAVASMISTTTVDIIRNAYNKHEPIYVGYENGRGYSIPICIKEFLDEDNANGIDIIYFDKDTYQRKCVRVNFRDERITLPNV